MNAISPSLVKELREKSGAGMMDCKKALDETKGDMESAVDWLRKKGLSQAAKKATRVAAEGLVGVTTSGTEGAVLEVNSETDFVARNEQFQSFVATASKITLEKKGDMEAMKAAAFPNSSRNVADELTNLVATIGENMSIRRAQYLSVSNGVVVSYVHNAAAPGLGKIGVLVALESTGDKAGLETLAKQICLHIAAAAPIALRTQDVSVEQIEREKDVLREQAKASGKPADIIEKMLDGRMRKYYEEVVLLEQIFVMDGETKIAKLVENAAKTVGAPVEIKSFTRFVLGDGIEKEEKDFAAEVAAQLATA